MNPSDYHLTLPVQTPLGPGTLFGITPTNDHVLVGFDKREFDISGWENLVGVDKSRDRSCFRLLPIESVEARQIPSTRPRRRSSNTVGPVNPTPEGVKVLPGQVWRSVRGTHERFSIVEVEGESIRLLGIDTPGYRRDTSTSSFFRFYSFSQDDQPSSPT